MFANIWTNADANIYSHVAVFVPKKTYVTICFCTTRLQIMHDLKATHQVLIN